MTAVELFFSNDTQHTLTQNDVAVLLSGAARLLALEKPVAVDVTVVGEKTIQNLNKFWRGKNTITDVLSFSSVEQKRGAPLFVTPDDDMLRLGQIVVCPSYVYKQARRNKEDRTKALKRVIVHGFLHLLGYDHERSAHDEEVMTALQEDIISHAH
jgi:probable rRNA maturation factor